MAYKIPDNEIVLALENEFDGQDIFLLVQEILEARAELKAYCWIPVSEPPENMLEVWVIGSGLVQTGRYINGVWRRIGYGGGMLTNITHWMPIPKLPEQQAGE